MIPFYLIAKTTLRGGRRLSKVPKWEPPAARDMLPAQYHRPPHIEVKPRNEDLVYDAILDFKNWEFRYWSVENASGQCKVSVCRCCEDMEIDPVKRKQHHKAHGCTTKLQDAYKLLLKDMKCVICDTPCYTTQWGVPICIGGTCLLKWKFDSTPMALAEALRISMGAVHDLSR